MVVIRCHFHQIYPYNGVSLGKSLQKLQHFVVQKSSMTRRSRSRSNRRVETVNIDGQISELVPGGQVFVPKGARYLIENKSNEVMELIAVQIGAYLGDDDVVSIAADADQQDLFTQTTHIAA